MLLLKTGGIIMGRILAFEQIHQFEKSLREAEKSTITIQKYSRDVYKFISYAKEREITKELVIEYKQHLIDNQYAIASINSMLASVNTFLKFLGWSDLQVKGIRTQKQIYCAEQKELSKEEYQRLLAASKEKPRLRLLLQTICSTGIRVSEIRYFTVEAVKTGEIHVSCKNKNRVVIIPTKLKRMLLKYAKLNHIVNGIIFRTKNGNPLNRSNIWAEMKTLCGSAHVNPTKVFPHNLRKLFARMFYKLDKDIAKLADILGHSSINTTRIYIISTGAEHRRQIERLGLIVT